MAKQVDLFDMEFRTAEEGSPLYCHQDFLQKVEENRKNQVGKRASLLLQRLVVDPRREHYKSTLGANKGWRRSRLGGNGGNHFYAWWAPKGAPPLRSAPGFENAPDGAIFLRDIRHHDNHSELFPQSLNEHYLPITTRDLRGEEYVPSPLTPTQAQFTSARQRVRIVKGYPGSGKTTALWHATDLNTAQAALYITYSKDLAALAKAHFQKYAPAHKQFHVLTFSRLMREIAGAETAVAPERDARDRFMKELGSLPPRVLGAWADDRRALYDEVHAQLIGSALPVAAGRFAGCQRPRLPDRLYREQRRRFIGGAAADAVLEVVNLLERRQPEAFCRQFFPELLLAWNAARELLSPDLRHLTSRNLLGFDCLAVDEAQDLTPIEAFAMIQLAAGIRKQSGRSFSLLVAGDEAQTIRPTDFEWGWFHDMLHQQLDSPQEFKLPVNLRSPRRIARLINSVWGLYATVSKQDRPSGSREAEIEEDASDQLVYIAASRGLELDQLLRAFGDREGLAIICLEESIPSYVPEDVRHKIVSVFEAKGLDFQAVCVLDPGNHLRRILRADERVRRDHDVEPLTKRLAIDQFRVAVSRPTERIYFLDVSPAEAAGEQSLRFLRWADPESDIAPAIPASVLKSLEEELLEPEERVHLCESDARQFLDAKPAMAWSRAKQAVSLLGREGSRQAVADPSVRKSAWSTLSQVCFSLMMREVKLPPELGHPDLVTEAERAARAAGRPGLADIIGRISVLRTISADLRLPMSVSLAEEMAEHQDELEPWFAVELSTRGYSILKELERGVTDMIYGPRIVQHLPFLYQVYGVLDGPQRTARLRQEAVKALMDARLFNGALELLQQDPESPPHQIAECHEGLGQFAVAAEMFRKLGRPKDALRNLRAIPDLDQALALMEETGDRSAEESLRWILELRAVLDKRPKNFARAATKAEKDLMTRLLEAQLEGPRVKKTAAKPRQPKKPRAPSKQAGR